MGTTTKTAVSEFVREWDADFLDLWPHRYDFLYAEHPAPGNKPLWQTEGRHPLSDRLIIQGSKLYGVRFGQKTGYVMLDIDSGSPYHPNQDPLALQKIKGVLESIELTESITLTSSYSGGLHVYFPLTGLMNSWKVGVAISSCLENEGFKIAPGLLESFPNAKPFSTDGSYSLYNGHRLPLQQGSYILNDALEPVYGDDLEFARIWRFATVQNGLEETDLDRIIKQNARKGYRVSGKARKYLNDLNAEIELGWTGKGQTNRLLGRIAMRGYVFGHVLLKALKPLVGQDLIEHICNVARALPGFSEFCSHANDLESKAKEWARSVENSHYYPYGGNMGKVAISTEETPRDWNAEQKNGARQRISTALGNLLEAGSLPSGITARFDALVSAGISGSTLYRNKDLWHPKHLEQKLHPEGENHPSVNDSDSLQDGQLQPNSTNKLGSQDGEGALSPTDPSLPLEETGGSGGISTGKDTPIAEHSKNMDQQQGLSFLRNILNGIKGRNRDKRFKRLSGDE